MNNNNELSATHRGLLKIVITFAFLSEQITTKHICLDTFLPSKYGGFSNEEDALAEIAKLRSALEKENCKYKEKFCYYCGYDSPVTLFGRRNEIWFIKETEVSTI